MGRYISVWEYATVFVVLSVLVLVFGIMWFMENLGYSALEQHYTILQNKYQSLLVQYEIETSNSTLLQLYKQSQESPVSPHPSDPNHQSSPVGTTPPSSGCHLFTAHGAGTSPPTFTAFRSSGWFKKPLHFRNLNLSFRKTL